MASKVRSVTTVNPTCVYSTLLLVFFLLLLLVLILVTMTITNTMLYFNTIASGVFVYKVVQD